jgi:hypothetical protein
VLLTNLLRVNSLAFFLSIVAVFSSVVYQSALLFWSGLIIGLASTIVCIFWGKNFKLTYVVIFALLTYIASVFNQMYWSNVIVPVADTNFSIQLVNLINSGGHLFAPAGTFRAVSYSYYPVTFLFGSMYSQVTGTNADFFAFFVYPILIKVLTLLLFFNIVAILTKNQSVALAAALLFSLNLQYIQFFSSFHYEGIAWVFLFLSLYYMLKAVNGQKQPNKLFILFSVVAATLCALTHHLTSFILLALLLSIGLLRIYTKFHRKLFKVNNSDGTLGGLSFAAVILPSIAIIATKIFFTFGSEEKMYSSFLFQLINSFFGLSQTSVGLARFDPWDYSSFELSLMIIGNLALFLIVVCSLYLSLRKSRSENRLMEILSLHGIWIFLIVFFSSFGTTYIFRFYTTLTFISAIIVSDQLFSSNNRHKIRKEVHVIIFAIVAILFFTSQLIMTYSYTIAEKPSMDSETINAGINFSLDKASLAAGNILACPAENFEAIFSRGMINNPYYAGYSPFSMVMNSQVPSNVKYLVLYSPLNYSFINQHILPKDRANWTDSVNSINGIDSRIYDNGNIQINYLYN